MSSAMRPASTRVLTEHTNTTRETAVARIDNTTGIGLEPTVTTAVPGTITLSTQPTPTATRSHQLQDLGFEANHNHQILGGEYARSSKFRL